MAAFYNQPDSFLFQIGNLQHALSTTEDIQGNLKKNKEYYDNLRKCYDLDDYIVTTPLYIDRARYSIIPTK